MSSAPAVTDLSETVRRNEGTAIQPVDARDLKCLHELCVERAKWYCGKDGAVPLESMVRTCNPGANLPAVWLRHTHRRVLYRQGLLTEWQHGTALEDAVFEIAATIPVCGLHFDHDEFLRQLHATRSPQSV